MNPLRAWRARRNLRDTGTTEPAREIPIVLLHTEIDLTEAALQEAARLARGLDAHIIVLAIRTPPFAERIDPARGLPGFGGLMDLAERTGVPVTIHVAYAHDWDTACDETLPKRALILIAARHSWIPTREERMAERLKRAGHNVALVAA